MREVGTGLLARITCQVDLHLLAQHSPTKSLAKVKAAQSAMEQACSRFTWRLRALHTLGCGRVYNALQNCLGEEISKFVFPGDCRTKSCFRYPVQEGIAQIIREGRTLERSRSKTKLSAQNSVAKILTLGSTSQCKSGFQSP